MKTNSNEHLNDTGKLVALPGNLKDLPLEDVLRKVYTHLLLENEHKHDRINELTERLRLAEQTMNEESSEKKHLLSKLNDEAKKNEGNKQLINKLLEDIRRYQNDIDWYRKTYEKRTLLGVLKEKLKFYFLK